MTAKEKQGFGLYFLFAFGMAWLCQVGGCMALLQQNNAVLYQLPAHSVTVQTIVKTDEI